MLASLVVGVFSTAFATDALSQDFYVSSGQTVGQQTLNMPGSVGLVELGGVVQETNATAVFMLDADQSVYNYGLISTTGNTAYGIFSSDPGAYIENWGRIATDGVGSWAIGSDDPNATVFNFGEITTQGSFSYGIGSRGDFARIRNDGEIRTYGTGADGIFADGDFARITNTGVVSTAGNLAYGIYAAAADGTIINSGTISSPGSRAISFFGDRGSLFLLDGSVIQGDIEFRGTANRLFTGPGLSALLSFIGTGLPTSINASGNPYVTQGNTIAVLDRAGFALTSDMLMSLASSFDRSNSGQGGVCLSVDPGTGFDCAARGWIGAAGEIGGRDSTEVLGGYGYHHVSVNAGIEFLPAADTSVGLSFGHFTGQGDAGKSYSVSLRGLIGAGFLQLTQPSHVVRLALMLGSARADTVRFVTDNTSGSGQDRAVAEEDSFIISPSVEFGTGFDLPTGERGLASVLLRYTHLGMGGFDEEGAADALEVQSRAVHELTLRTQLSIPLAVENFDGLSLSARTGAEAYMRWNRVEGSLVGQEIGFKSGDDGVGLRAFAGLDLELNLTPSLRVSGSWEGRIDDMGDTSSAAHLRLSASF